LEAVYLNPKSLASCLHNKLKGKKGIQLNIILDKIRTKILLDPDIQSVCISAPTKENFKYFWTVCSDT
jgi:hypothetical protein